MQNFKIECPKCRWEPQPHDRWECSCGHLWNTFDTQGKCPRCQVQWEHTQCLSAWEGGCAQWSPHVDWYVIPIDISEILEEEKEGQTVV